LRAARKNFPRRVLHADVTPDGYSFIGAREAIGHFSPELSFVAQKQGTRTPARADGCCIEVAAYRHFRRRLRNEPDKKAGA
jgi:hypothetical protein